MLTAEYVRRVQADNRGYNFNVVTNRVESALVEAATYGQSRATLVFLKDYPEADTLNVLGALKANGFTVEGNVVSW